MTPEFDAFLQNWTKDGNNVRPLFIAIYELLSSLEEVELEYKGRPGVSHSLRARHKAQKQRSLFVLVDVIDDEPDMRWLSVCFYADLVSDPEGRGDVVPGGLMGEDACCFDIEAPEEEVRVSILTRLKEAHANASRE